MEKKIWIGLTILVILLIGTSFAWWYWNSTANTNISLTVDGVTVTFDGGQDITGVNLIPVSSKEKGVNDGTAIEKVVTASSTSTLYMNLNLTLEEFPEALQHESLVWEIYNGATLVGSGNFGSAVQGDVIPLATHQEITSTTISFQLYIWIDGNIDNSESMMNQNFKFVLSAEGENETQLEPNEPNTSNGLIPVTYNGSTWIKADNTNANNSWYNYYNKQWANAVAVTSDYRNEDGTDTFEIGDVVPEDAVLAYYVWIPRYKYKVWNITKTVGTDSYDAQNTGIDIVWESGTESTGTISCTYDFTITDGSLSEICTGSNGDYYTHPAFWWDEDGDGEKETTEQLTGIWVGKFEISTPPDSTCYESSSNANCRNTTLAVRTKPNANPWRYNYLSNFSTAIQTMSANHNEYGIATNAESHMLKNMEWGAVAYLTHSNYGRCTDGVCTEVSFNSYYGGSEATGYKTGCGPQSEGSTNYGTLCNEYNSKLGQLSSTTGNMYGIYDMSGGSDEYMMANMSSTAGSYIYFASSGDSNSSYSAETAKYIDTYAYGTSDISQTGYNRARLGDATGEVVVFSEKAWNSDIGYFVYSYSPWFNRGGSYLVGSSAGVFNFNRFGGNADSSSTTRAALLAF